MPYVPGFQFDVFLSYAWVNNYLEDDRDPESGWITRFRKRLQPRLDERLGRIGSAGFFIDHRSLNRERDFDDSIEAALRQSATVLAFFSGGYLDSAACGAEMRYFHQLAGANSGRLFIVRVEEIKPADWPEEYHEYLKNVIGYKFFGKGPSDGSMVKLMPGSSEFDSEFEQLRTNLAKQLKSMRGAPRKENAVQKPVESPPKPAVLIARPTPDLRKERGALASYCASAGLRVLPDSNWPSANGEFCDAFAAALLQSHLFVQLLSDSFADRDDRIPDGIETWQFQQARQAGLTILQWRDKATVIEEVDDAIHRKLLAGADVRTDLPAEFHQEVVERTRRAFQMAQDKRGETANAGTTKLVMIKAHSADDRQTARIVEIFKAANITYRLSENGVSMVARLRETPFDALIVVLGQGDRAWVEARGDELMAVDLNLKDQVPLRAYCHVGERRLVPYAGRNMLEVVSPDELNILIDAIQRRAVK